VKHATANKTGEILFLRVPPRGLIRSAGDAGHRGPNRLACVFASNGFRGRVGEWSVTSFWIGMGRRVRVPGRQILERVREGAITEIIDIGCAGALDPGLRRGDLVLSSADIASDGGAPVAVRVVRRGAELLPLLHDVAASRGVTFRRASILTHERFVARRDGRTELFEQTGCVAVQMEHLWFLRLLQSLTSADCFNNIRVTHLVLITDAVPGSASRMATARSTWDALSGYAFPGGSTGIMSLRRELLSRWPSY
jgi:hypothetical protein